MDALIDAFIAALATYDADALTELLGPDFRHWLSITEQEQGADGLVAVVRLEREHVAKVDMQERRRVRTEDGFVLMLDVEGTTNGGHTFRVPVCLVATVATGRIVRLDEYADASRVAPLLRELSG